MRCGDGSFYTGMTNDLEKRFKAHCEKKAGCKYTRRKDKHPLALAAAWEVVEGKGGALRLEHLIKSLDLQTKQMLVCNPAQMQLFLTEKRVSDKVLTIGSYIGDKGGAGCLTEK